MKINILSRSKGLVFLLFFFLILLSFSKSLLFSQNIKARKVPVYHVVRRGESLGLIAKRYHVSVRFLKKINHLKGNIIYPGQKLIVGYKLKYPEVYKVEKEIPGKGKEIIYYYVVKRGDSLQKIAKKFGISVSFLKKVNRLRKEIIYPRQKLIVKIKKISFESSTKKPSKKVSSKKTPKSKLPESPERKKTILKGKPVKVPVYHVVRRGESLGLIAKRYHVSVRFLKKINHLKGNIIYPGQKLIVGYKLKYPEVYKVEKEIPGKGKEIIYYYVVKRGDSLQKIAKKFGASLSYLKKLNNLSKNRVRPGDQIIIKKIYILSSPQKIPLKKEPRQRPQISSKNKPRPKQIKASKKKLTEAEKVFYSLEKEFQSFIKSDKTQIYDIWKSFLIKYRRLYLLYPESPVAPKALLRTAEIYLKLYKSFKNRDFLNLSIKEFKNLIKRYPKSKECEKAYYYLIKIYKEILHNEKESQRLLEEFKKAYPKSSYLIFLKPVSFLSSLKFKKISNLCEISLGFSSSFNLTNKGVLENQGIIKYFFDFSPVICPKKFLGKDFRFNNSLPLKKITIGQFNKTTTRIVLITKSPLSYNLKKSGTGFLLSYKCQEEPKKAHFYPSLNPSSLTLAKQFGLKIKTIVIDPGHGGDDPGAIGKYGLKEKDLTLKIALELKKLLEKNLKVRVYLTRSRDKFVPLLKRARFANRVKADLFISIHLNASPDPRAKGIETYYLNFTTDPEAMKVAALENRVAKKSLSELRDLVKAILANTKINESRELALKVQKALVKTLSKSYSGIEDRGVKCAPFLVLVGTKVPAILIEVGFITNPKTAKRLKSKKYIHKIAEGIYRGIRAYIRSLEFQS